ncbi:MAG: hypothetical protein ABF868_11260 [Sporolactobacillus sp.]
MENKDWIHDFEASFNIQCKNQNRMIIGERPYKQRIGSYDLKLQRGNMNIAFLTTEWIKITDTLEALFSLLFYSRVKGIKALSFFMENRIKPIDFADYLEQNHRIYLINRLDEMNKSNLQNIKNILSSVEENFQILFLGNKAFKDSSRIQKGNDCIQVLHPSGYNISTNSNDYYSTWYKFRLLNNNSNLNLRSFSII